MKKRFALGITDQSFQLIQIYFYGAKKIKKRKEFL